MQRTLVTIGECMVELAETPDGTYRRGFAGDTFNAAWYARRALGPDWDVAFASCIGDDSVSDEMASFIEAGGIATDRLRRIPSRSVGLYMISLTAGERSFSYWRDTSAARSLVDDPGWLRRVLSADHVHFSGITLAILSSEGRGRLCDVLARVRENGATVSFDTNIRQRLWPDADEMRRALMQAAKVSDIVLPSFDEEAACFGDVAPPDTIARYRRAGATSVVVKNGAAAVTLWSETSGMTEIEVTPVKRIVDTTAAGDSFAGAYLAANLRGLSAPDAACRAADVAARVIGSSGALVSFP